MRIKLFTTLLALTALAASVAGPAQAQETDTGTDGPDAEEVEDESEGDGDGLGPVRSAAARAKSAAKHLEDGDADPELKAGLEHARDALQAALDRFSTEDADGAGGAGVAADVLTALLDGNLPAGIRADHGKAMAQAAAERRAARAGIGHGRPDNTGVQEDAAAP